MNRVIKDYNPSDITMELINGNDWDYIVLNKQIDADGIYAWWRDVDTTLSHLKFNFVHNNNLVKTQMQINDNAVGYRTNASDNKFHNTLLGNKELISSYTLTWPIQRYEPLPPPWAADIAHFDELSQFVNCDNIIVKDIDPTGFKYLTPYMFGEFKKMYDDWGKDFFINTRISVHEPEMIIPLHTDGFTTRLHIPMTHDNSKFYWGECWDREYKWEVGYAYLINSHITHSTTNFGPNVRANILTSIGDNKILELLSLE